MTRTFFLTLALGAGTLAAAQGVTTIPATPLGAPSQTMPVQTMPERAPAYPSGYTTEQLQAAQRALDGLPGLSALELDQSQGRLRVTVGTAVQRVAVLQRLTQAGLPTGLVTFAPNAATTGGATGTVTETPITPPATTPPVSTPDPRITPVPGGRVTVTELASGTNAATSTPAVQVATTQAALNALYRVAYGNQTGTPAVPTLRSGETVVAVFLGQRPTGGYGIRVTGASVQNGTLTLTVEIRAPGPGAITTQALTSPWTLVRAPGTFTRVQLVDAAGRPVQLGTGGGETR
ncbi:protease complex subunit PrcB family protein [Deinococcus sp. MIMF12]|uniref:Protease complex subunit PrcB family protein n=1 Tax=Deinococcus rhizophilus TaxID=3049544 RepID=A0ABT7JKA2_9DEIO|nr:protease complex subunit PrcB family protein [Deinococcus rhizophilus]MDL2344883.1 protease complex subunit PrcB family protein [Deinococcus rhizophilus]